MLNIDLSVISFLIIFIIHSMKMKVLLKFSQIREPRLIICFGNA